MEIILLPYSSRGSFQYLREAVISFHVIYLEYLQKVEHAFVGKDAGILAGIIIMVVMFVSVIIATSILIYRSAFTYNFQSYIL